MRLVAEAVLLTCVGESALKGRAVVMVAVAIAWVGGAAFGYAMSRLVGYRGER